MFCRYVHLQAKTANNFYCSQSFIIKKRYNNISLAPFKKKDLKPTYSGALRALLTDISLFGQHQNDNITVSIECKALFALHTYKLQLNGKVLKIVESKLQEIKENKKQQQSVLQYIKDNRIFICQEYESHTVKNRPVSFFFFFK